MASEESLLLKPPAVKANMAVTLEDDPKRWSRVRFWSRAVLLILWVASTVLFGLLVWQMVIRNAEKSSWAIATSFAAVCIAVPLSLYDIHVHLQNYVSPLQRHYIRIISMVPSKFTHTHPDPRSRPKKRATNKHPDTQP
jgi:hypothetical protein